MRKQRFAPDGAPIIDEPLLSLRRLASAHGIWCFFVLDGLRYPGYGYWYVLRYWRRPYARRLILAMIFRLLSEKGKSV